MISSLAYFIGFRFSYGKSQGGISSLVAVISTFGIALSIAVLIISLSAMNGFERELNQRILSVVPHGEFEPVNRDFTAWVSVLSKIEKVAGVVAAAPYIRFTGLIECDSKVLALQIKGIDPKLESCMSALSSYVTEDTWKNFLPNKHQILVGQGIINSLSLKIGDWITMMIPSCHMEDQILQPKYVRLQLAGILNLNGVLDHNLAYIPIEDAQKLLCIGNNITGIAIKAKHPFEADLLVRQVGEAMNLYVYLHSWIGTYGYMYHDIQMIRTIIYLSIVLVIGIACFNISSTLMIAVHDKRRQIAILRTLGANNSLIRSIFIWYGLLLGGVLGSLVGIVIGSLVALKLTSIVEIIEKLTGCHFLSRDVYFIDFLPSEVQISDVVIIFVTSIVLSLFASWYPARKASRLCPAQALSSQ
ncbi:lipoprotein-releasing ABC transporter permease subunit LolE [Candidatus Erwinia haradaeae]|uniref:Lipoprotein-releasing system transmembrane protein LolE n=1 Tax=Candidatus Erwinia haradaeae TaxID=1922217 RepID=A0A451DID0_9GAMM|nr:lipoprotein-releasing ABC transporter permease subunit LolE [Candidatus Erwinia haradaeae]VFP86421.1 Lipoprotein-releasing system transmembrane protein LolE [Candidatus Erwinia haradaeae]